MTILSLAALRFLNQGEPAAALDATDLLGRDALWPRWIWEERIQGTIENSQKVAIVLSLNGTWTNPNSFNTLQFPRLQVDIWADPTRNSDNSVQLQDAKSKVYDTYMAIRPFLHNITPDIAFWDTTRVISSLVSADPTYNPVRDGNGACMGQFFVNCIVG